MGNLMLLLKGVLMQLFTDNDVARLREIERDAYKLTLIEECSLSRATPEQAANLIAQLCAVLASANTAALVDK